MNLTDNPRVHTYECACYVLYDDSPTDSRYAEVFHCPAHQGEHGCHKDCECGTKRWRREEKP